ncbi:transcriptional regulator, LysR family [Desulfovibrio sp. X2]|uniref:LysR family transcriptional regulator n=1 Tax=Desulfovibrio sp. X2 TaxID=941449 RepID=UPI000358D593|nr:LysR family transcriptional regulator [Desulfovibrio sp. X2]EPR43655.1 transcriptional regulator, LysR family [Desulfovibrio sp. X2]
MELRHIRYFLAVAEERNFTRAAARLGISQPPLSQQIRDLEAEVGAELFMRVPQGAELTEAGRAFRDTVQSLPMQAERALRSARRAARGETGVLRLGFTGAASFNPAVTSVISAFRSAYPDVELSLEEANTTRLAAALSRGDLDAAFLRPVSATGGELDICPIAMEPMLAVVPTGHAAAGDEKLDLRRLEYDPFILTPRPVGLSLFDTVVSACRSAGFEPIFGQSAPQISSVVNFVAAQMGVSLVPACMRALSVPGVVYRELAGQAPVTRLALAWRRTGATPLARNFAAAARE